MDPREVLTRPGPSADLVVRYAAHVDGLIDVHLPPAAMRPDDPSPLVVLVHGGFWRQVFDRRHLRPLASSLAHDGWVVASIEFRRVGGTGGWPTTGRDVESALGQVADLIEEAAPGRIDPSARIVLCGHSAGGHLAFWAGLHLGPERVARIVGLAPVLDLVASAQRGIGEHAVSALLGGSPSERPEAYADADALRLLPSSIPVRVLHGSDDQRVPVDLTRSVANAHHEIGYVELAGVEHFALIDPLAPTYDVLRASLGKRPNSVRRNGAS